MTLIEKHEQKFQKLFEEKGRDITAFIKNVAERFALQEFEHRKQKEFIGEFVREEAQEKVSPMVDVVKRVRHHSLTDPHGREMIKRGELTKGGES